MDSFRRSHNPSNIINGKKEIEKPISYKNRDSMEKVEIYPLFKKYNSDEITQISNRFEKIYRNKRNLKTSFEDSFEESFGDSFEDNDKPKIDINININEVREEIENENANLPKIYIYYKAYSPKNFKSFNRIQSKNLESKIIFPVESRSSEMKKEHQKANSANTKKKFGKNATSKTYLKNSSEFMRIVQAMKLDKNK